MARKESLIALPTGVTLHTTLSTPSGPSSRPTLLLIHFWGGCNRTWLPLIEHLQEDYDIIAPSQRGWGQSSAPQDPKAYSIEAYAADIVALIQNVKSTLPGRFKNGIILIGHSMGGKIAQYLLTKDEIASYIRGLVLIAPAPAGAFQLPEEMREQQIHAYDHFESAEFVVRNVLLAKPDTVSNDAAMQLAAEAVAGSPEARAAWPTYGMAEDYEYAVAKAIPIFKERHGHQVRALVVASDQDRVETAENVDKRVAALLKEAGASVTSKLLEGVGHLIPIEAAGRLAEMIKVQGWQHDALEEKLADANEANEASVLPDPVEPVFPDPETRLEEAEPPPEQI